MAAVRDHAEFKSRNPGTGRPPYSVVHIASHGKFEGRVSDSFILTYNDRPHHGRP